jgi:hypothetical protein
MLIDLKPSTLPHSMLRSTARCWRAESLKLAQKGAQRHWPSSCGRAGAVECWIGVAREGGRCVLRLAGRLGEAQVPELLLACAAERAVHLDLTDLESTDAAGLEALSRVRHQGATISGAPKYIQLKLDAMAGKPNRGRS